MLALVGDVRSATDMQLAVETATRHFGRLDAVVASAGVIAAGAPLWEISDAAWDAVWSVNVLGTRRLIEAAAPTLIANGRDANSRIVAVASAAGSTGLYHLAAYSAAKHAVVGLIRGVAMDLAEHGVTANAVSPGSTRTAILKASAEVYGLTVKRSSRRVSRLADCSNRARSPPPSCGCVRPRLQPSPEPILRLTAA